MPDPAEQTLPKILYIEDNPEARLLLGRLLQGQYVLLSSGDPLSGIELAEQMQPDLVLLDINLPYMNGADVAVRLRCVLKPGTPLVALTADFAPGLREHALEVGFCGFMSKPIDLDTFYDQIEAFLHGKHEQPCDDADHLRAYQMELVERSKGLVEPK